MTQAVRGFVDPVNPRGVYASPRGGVSPPSCPHSLEMHHDHFIRKVQLSFDLHITGSVSQSPFREVKAQERAMPSCLRIAALMVRDKPEYPPFDVRVCRREAQHLTAVRPAVEAERQC